MMNDKMTKISMFLDGELSKGEMAEIENLLNIDEEGKEFVINAAIGNAYSKFFFLNEMPKNDFPKLETQKKQFIPPFLRAAAIAFLIILVTFLANIAYDRYSPSRQADDNLINPFYQGILNTALENHESKEPYEGLIPGLKMHVTIIPEKTYRYNGNKYIRKFIIRYALSGRTIDVEGFAQRKKKELWEIKTLTF